MSKTTIWYAELIKPSWAPPSWLFGPVWTILYVVIAVTYIPIFARVLKGKLPKKTAVPLVLNLFFNFIYSPIQFGLQNNYLAVIDIVLVFATLVWTIKTIWKIRGMRWAAIANIPYLAWVAFATVLQFSITYLNI